MKRPLTVREVVLSLAATAVAVVGAGVSWLLLSVGCPSAAVGVGLVTLPIALYGLAHTAWIVVRLLKASAGLRRQRAEAERSSGGGSDA